MRYSILEYRLPGCSEILVRPTNGLFLLIRDANNSTGPIPTRLGSNNRIVAPISTVVFVNKTHKEGDEYEHIIVPKSSNLPSDKHFSDVAAPGTVVIMQQPYHQIAALLGDIVGTRYKARGVLGVVTDGRMRDVIGCEELCKQGNFTSWTKSYSCVGTSIEGMYFLLLLLHWMASSHELMVHF
jgi:hypothetical protein